MSPGLPITPATAIPGWNFTIPARPPLISPVGIFRQLHESHALGIPRRDVRRARPVPHRVARWRAGGIEWVGVAHEFPRFANDGFACACLSARNRPAVLDYINYTVVGERSIGYFPDGVFGPRDSFFVTTPGAANDNTAAPLPVFINEWMAANTSFVADPPTATSTTGSSFTTPTMLR